MHIMLNVMLRHKRYVSMSTSTNPRLVLHKPPFDEQSVRCITIFTSSLRLPCHESPFHHLTL